MQRDTSSNNRPHTAFLVLIRHGIPEEFSDKEDYFRKLTPTGCAIQEAATRLLQQYVPEIHHLYSSPLVRAQETAAIVAKNYKIPIQTEPAFGLPAQREKAFTLISNFATNQTVAIVSHGPVIAMILSFFKWMHPSQMPPHEIERSGALLIRIDTARPHLPIQPAARMIHSALYLRPPTVATTVLNAPKRG